MPICEDCLEDYPDLGSTTCGICQRVNKVHSQIEKEELRATLVACQYCGLAGPNVNRKDPVCGSCRKTHRPEDSEPPQISGTAKTIVERAELFRAGATALRIKKTKDMTTTDITAARLDMKKTAKVERLNFEWDVYFCLPTGKKTWTDTGATITSEIFPLSTKMSEVFATIRQHALHMWNEGEQFQYRRIYNKISTEHTEVALRIIKPKLAIKDFKEDKHSQMSIRDILPFLTEQFKWTTTADMVVLCRVQIRLPYKDLVDEMIAPAPVSRKRAKGRGASEDLSVIGPNKAANKRTSKTVVPRPLATTPSTGTSLFASSLLDNSGIANLSQLQITVVRRFTKLDVKVTINDDEDAPFKFTNDSIDQADAPDELRIVSNVQPLDPNSKPKGYYKGVFKGLYYSTDVAIAIAEGREEINYSEDDNMRLLVQEAKVLAIGRALATAFFKRIDDAIDEGELSRNDVLKFVFSDAFIADFGEDAITTSSYLRTTTKVVARRYALVTPLLPTWPKNFIKFTGANVGFNLQWRHHLHSFNLAEDLWDRLRPLLIAFVHFSYHRSGGTMVFADIQGAWSSSSKLFIVADPQLHTWDANASNPEPMASWDQQPDGIRTFCDAHVCNHICEALELPEIGASSIQSTSHTQGGPKFSVAVLNSGRAGPKAALPKPGKPVES